jgi:hypothetical protein
MNLHRDPDAILAAWLDEGPVRLPVDTRQAIAVGIRSVPRRRTGFVVPWGRLRLPALDPGRLPFALGGAAVVVLAAALAMNFYFNQRAISGPSVAPGSPFAGTWINTTDADGGTQTMTVTVSVGGAIDIKILDDIASVCSGTPSTMTGTGRIEGSTKLVLPAPVYTCDDGTEAKALSGPPLAEQLRNMTFVYHAESDTLTVGGDSGPVWRRDGAPDSSAAPATSTVLWPQRNLDEVRRAQQLADAGDPNYTWQVDPELSSDDPWLHLAEGRGEIVARYLREELGWKGFVMNPYQGNGNSENGTIHDVVYIRCAAGESNTLYANDPSDTRDDCAPTIDELRYESVSLDLSQLAKRGATGVWVISRSGYAPPFAQAVPPTAAATELLNAFLSARLEGSGAETFAGSQEWSTTDGPPLLYATTSGAPYERFEFDVVSGPEWPHGNMTFQVRLFADGGSTVVEQRFFLNNDSGVLELEYFPRGDSAPTTENGQPVAVQYRFLEGGWVSLRAAYPWGEALFSDAGLNLNREFWESFELLTDPLTVGTGCASGSSAADAKALADAIRSDPDLVSTAPVPITIDEMQALSMDVTAAPSASICAEMPGTQVLTPDDNGSYHGLTLPPDGRMRLYLLDLPAGSPNRILAIAISASESRFGAVMEAAAPVVQSLTFTTR